MRSFPLLAIAFLGMIVRPVFTQEDDDKVVFGKRASEWVKVLRADKEVLKRRQALVALESAGPHTRKIFDEIGSAMRLDPEERVRLEATRALGRLAARAVDPDKVIEKLNIKPAVDALIAALSKEKSPAVREAVAEAITRIGPDAKEAIPSLAAVLKDESLAVRAAAADALSRMGPLAKTAVKELTDAVKDSKSKDQWRTRLNAARALNRIGRPDGLSAVSVLIAALGEPEPGAASPEERRELNEVRRQLIEALGTLGDVAAATILTQTLDRAMEVKDITLGRASLTALTRLQGDKKALLPALVRAMAPPAQKLQDHHIRCDAIAQVGQLGKDLGEHRDTVVKNLRQGLTDKLAEVRLAAIFALGELGPTVLDKDLPGIIGSLRVLQKSSEKAIGEAAEATLKRLEKT